METRHFFKMSIIHVSYALCYKPIVKEHHHHKFPRSYWNKKIPNIYYMTKSAELEECERPCAKSLDKLNISFLFISSVLWLINYTFDWYFLLLKLFDCYLISGIAFLFNLIINF